MTRFCHEKPSICRIVTVAIGIGLFVAGVDLGGLWGLILMIVGLVPVVTGVADVSLLAEIRDERAHRRERRRRTAVASGRRA
jgi:fatty acid desaturase